VYVGIFILLAHFICVFVYCKNESTNNTSPYFVNRYVSSFFHQSWKLFAPPPNANYQLYACTEDHDAIDIMQELRIKNQNNRFSGNGHALVSFVNYIHFFEKSTPLIKSINGPIANDQYFKMLEQASRIYWNEVHQADATNLKLILVVENYSDKKKRVYYN